MFRPVLSPLTWLYIVVLALILSGCQRTPSAGPDTFGPDTLAGVITEGWPGQPASLRLEAVTFLDATVLAEAPIGADGRFTMPLPGEQGVAGALTPLYEICDSLEVSPSPLDVLYAEARVYASTSANAEPVGVLGYQADSAEGLISVILVYAASAGRVSGSCRDLGLDFNLDLLEGWNQVLYTESRGGTTLTTGSLPDGLRWRYYATSGELGPPAEPPGPPVEPPEPTPTTPLPKR